MFLHCLVKIIVSIFVLLLQIQNSSTTITNNHVKGHGNHFSNNQNDNPYKHVVNLDPEGRFILEWIVDWTLDRIIFKVTVQTTGYIGLGLSPRGRKLGSDIVIGGVDSTTGIPYFVDMHGSADGNQTIRRDDSQDYRLHYALENKTHTILHFSRAFDTCDANDLKINDNAISVLWAFGENDNDRLYHYNRRGAYKAYLLDPDWTPSLIQEAKRTGTGLNSALETENVHVWTIQRKQRVPALDTSYWCSFHKGPVLNRRHHLIGFDFRWKDSLEFQHTHHLLFYRCTPPPNVDPVSFFNPFVNSTGEMCYFLARGHVGGMPTQYCSEILYPYAIGSRMFFFPEHMGISFGYSPDEYYLLQVHYDNPDRLTNLEYEINIDLYYTSNLRQHEAGVMTIGHQIPGSPSIIIPPYSLDHKIYGHCGSLCTNDMIPAEGIKIIGVQQHTHYSGIRHRFQHFRGKVELPWIFNDDNYDNRFQPTRMTRHEVDVLPGDHLMTTCVYDNTWFNGSVVGGFSTRQEMCLVYIWYYNKMEYSLCRSEMLADDGYFQRYLGIENFMWSEQDLEYISTNDGLTVSEVVDKMEWTIAKRRQLQKDHQWLPQTNICNSWSLIRARAVDGANVNDTVIREGHLVGYPGGGIAIYEPADKEQICKRRGNFGWRNAQFIITRN